MSARKPSSPSGRGVKPSSPKLAASPSSATKPQIIEKTSMSASSTIAPAKPHISLAAATAASKAAAGGATATRPLMSGTGGPIRALATKSSAQGKTAAAAATVPATSSSATPSTKRTRPIRPTPDDSDYDSDEVFSEDEIDDIAPVVHAQAVPLSFELTPVKYEHLTPDELEARKIVSAQDTPLKFGEELLKPVGKQCHPQMEVEIVHQSIPFVDAVEKTIAAGGNKNSKQKKNIMSYSSGPAPSQSNDLLYTDCHAPYTRTEHARPLTIWLVGKPMSGKRTMARKLQKELSGMNNQSDGSKKGVDTVTPSIPHLTPEFLIAHARELMLHSTTGASTTTKSSSSTSSSLNTTFPEVELILQNLLSGSIVTSSQLFSLFIYILHSDRVKYHGYILGELPFAAIELLSIELKYPGLKQAGIWPPQYIIDLDLTNDDVLLRYKQKTREQVQRKLEDAMGFKDWSVGEDVGEDGEGNGTDSASSHPAGGYSVSRPVSAASIRSESSAYTRSGIGGGDGQEEIPYLGAYTLQKSMTQDDVTDEYDEAREHEISTLPSLILNQASLLLSADGGREEEVLEQSSIKQDLAAYEVTRQVLVKLLKQWSEYHHVNMSYNSEENKTNLNTLPSLHHLLATHPINNIYSSILYILGQNKSLYHTTQSLAMPFVSKEELKPIEEDQIREVLVLQNLNSKETIKAISTASHSTSQVGIGVGANEAASTGGAKSGIGKSATTNAGGTASTTTLSSLSHISSPQTYDPSGLDLTTEALYDTPHTRHLFGVYQTSCPVSLKDEGKLVEGHEDYAVTYEGIVYLFASQACLFRFQQNPRKYVNELPPQLPKSYCVAIVGGPSVGKTSVAKKLAGEYEGWNVLTLDGTLASLSSASHTIRTLPGRYLLDNGPSSIEQMEFFLKKEQMRVDKVVYLYVEDVECVPPRVRAAVNGAENTSGSNTSSGTSSLSTSMEEMPNSSTGISGKKSGKKGDESSTAATATAAAVVFDPTPEEDELMDRLEEYQAEWLSTFLPYLEEQMIPCTEVNNSVSGGIATNSTTGTTTTSVVISKDKALDNVTQIVRQLLDPFYLYRSLTAAHRLTSEEVETSKTEEDRILRTQEARELKYNDTMSYCPVSLIDEGLLISGVPNEAVAIGQHTYSCGSKDSTEKFLSSPEKYHVYTKQGQERLMKMEIPLRVMVVGSRSTGKSHTAQLLQQQYNLTYNFSLSSFVYPALHSLAEKTLTEAERVREEKEKKKKEKERKRNERQVERLKKRKEERLAAGLPEKEDQQDENGTADSVDDSDSDDSDVDDTIDVSSSSTAINNLTTGPTILGDTLEDRADLLRDFLSTRTHTESLEHAETLGLVLEAEIFTAQQLDVILKDVFVAHAHTSSPSNGERISASWVCEVDFTHTVLLSRLESLLKSSDEKHIRPQVIVPVECSREVAIARMIEQEQVRRRKVAANAAANVGDSTADSSLNERQRKREALLKQKQLEQERQREVEAAAAAATSTTKSKFDKKGSGSGRFSTSAKQGRLSTKKTDQQQQDDSHASSASSSKASTARSTTKSASKKSLLSARDDETHNAAGEDTVASTAATSATHSEANTHRDGSVVNPADAPAVPAPTTVDLVQLAADELDRLTAQLSDIHKLNIEIFESFFAAVKILAQDRYVVVESIMTSWNDGVSAGDVNIPATTFLTKLTSLLQPFLQIRDSLFHIPIPCTIEDASKLIRIGMKSLRTFGTLCPCCLKEGVVRDCMQSAIKGKKQNQKQYPLIWSSSMIYTCSSSHSTQFVSSPRTYLIQQPPQTKIVQSVLVLSDATGVGAGTGEDSTVTQATELAKKVAVELGLVYLNMSEILTKLVSSSGGNSNSYQTAQTALRQQVSSYLRSGSPVPDVLLISALSYRLHSYDCLTRGWVLDGFPHTIEQAKMMRQEQVCLPMDVVVVRRNTEMNATTVTPISSSMYDKREALLSALINSGDDVPLSSSEPDILVVDSSQPFSSSSLASKKKRHVSSMIPKGVNLEDGVVVMKNVNGAVSAASTSAPSVSSYFSSVFHTVTSIPTRVYKTLSSQSSYLLSQLAQTRQRHEQYRIATNAISKERAKPVSIRGLGITKSTMVSPQHTSLYREYCPVSWITAASLDTSPQYRANEHTVVYQQKFYRMASAEHEQEFMRNPDAYVKAASSDHKSPLPQHLPFRVSSSDISRGITSSHCELNGFCPVSLLDSQVRGAISVVPGEDAYLVAYKGRLWKMASETKCLKFMSKPEYYSRASLPQKMPPTPPPAVVSIASTKSPAQTMLDLGKTLAFMELTFQQLLIRALASFENITKDSDGGSNDESASRLKYPSLPLSSSALLYLSLYLKAHNPRNSAWESEKYGKKLQEYVEHCKLVPKVAQVYKSPAVSASKKVEESKEQTPQEVQRATSITRIGTATSSKSLPPSSSSSSQDDACHQYDTIRAEMRAHASGQGERKNLEQYFERYLR